MGPMTQSARHHRVSFYPENSPLTSRTRGFSRFLALAVRPGKASRLHIRSSRIDPAPLSRPAASAQGSPPQVAGLQPNETQFSIGDYVLAVLVGALAFALYLRTLAPGLLGGDSGEFQFAAWLGGFAHPTGYPLYLMLGYLWTHLIPLHDPAWRMNAFSAVWGGLAVGLSYLLARTTLQLVGISHPGGASAATCRLAALFVALTFAATPTFWSQAVIAEVYTLHAMLVIGVLLGLLRWSVRPAERHSYRPLYCAAAAFGLGLAHHRSMLLLVPGIVVYLWYGRRRSESWALRLGGLARALPLVALPLLLYAYIPLRAPLMPYAQIRLGPANTLDLYQPTANWLIAHMTGQVFGQAIHVPASPSDELLAGAGMLAQEVTPLGILLGLVGVWMLARRSHPLLVLTGLCFVSVVTFNLIYGIGDIFVFYIPAYLIWCLWMGLGVAWVGTLLGDVLAGRIILSPGPPRRSQSGDREWATWLAPVAVGLGLVLPLWMMATNYRQVDQSQNHAPRTAWEQILSQPIPANAILVSNDRDEMVPLWYLQQVEHVRPDLIGLFPRIQATPEWADVGQVIDTARRTKRPVLLVKPMPGLEIKYRTESAGSLVEVLGPAVEKPPEKDSKTDFADTLRLTGYDLQPSMVRGGEQVDVTLYWQPLQHPRADYTTFVHLVNADGAVVGQSDHAAGGVYYPTRLWKPGELIKDVHRLSLAADPGRPPYAIEVGLYTNGAELQHLGRSQRVGFVSQARPADPLPTPSAGEDSSQASYTFGGEMTLADYEWAANEAGLHLRFLWQALQSPSRDYTAFVHVLDAAGNIVAQVDQPPGGAEVPTRTWPASYVLADDVTITLRPDLPPGEYQLIGGLYDAATLERLPVVDENGVSIGDTAPLGNLVWPPAVSPEVQ